MFNTEKISWQEVENAQVLVKQDTQSMKVSLFSKLKMKPLISKFKKLENTKISNAKPILKANPMKEEITFDDFTKIDLRTATILEAEKVEKADKLLKLK